MKMLLLASMIVALLSSCDDNQTSTAVEPEDKVVPDPGFVGGEGDTLENGQLVFHVFESVKGDPPYRTAVGVAEDYGMIIFNTGTYEEPVLTVKFCSAKEKWIKPVRGIDEVLKTIQTFSEGATLGRYDTCLVPRRAGLSHDLIEEVLGALVARRITVIDDEDRHITCICPTQE